MPDKEQDRKENLRRRLAENMDRLAEQLRFSITLLGGEDERLEVQRRLVELQGQLQSLLMLAGTL